MYHRKCDLCGYVTDIKDETTSHCGDCGMSFDPTFAEWHAKHPDKTFEDFNRKYCMSGYKFTTFKKQKKIWPILGVSLAIGFYVYTFHFYKDTTDDIVGTFQKEMSKVSYKWAQHEIPEIGVRYEAPFSLKREDMPLSSEEQERFEWNRMYAYSDVTDNYEYSMLCHAVKFKENSTNVTIDAFFNIVIDKLTSNSSATKLKYSLEPLVDSVFSAGKLSATLNINGKPTSFMSFVYIKSNRLWNFTISSSGADSSFDATTQQIIKSIHITCTDCDKK